jgi:histidyl-tRNA synthetase
LALYSAPRGTQDIFPEDQPYWRHIQKRIHYIAQLYGYQQLDTPIFEATPLFEHGVGETTDIVEKEMYSFLDKGGDPITLRPEFTAGVVRAYLEHGMHVRPQPVKVYSLGPVFRYERPQAGRYRQHTQFNVEAIGEQDPVADLEVMSVAWHLYEDLGFKGLSFQLNSIGCPKCRPNFLKVLVEYYRGHLDDICDDCRRRLERNPLRLLDCKTESCQPIIDAAPSMREHLCDECAEHFEALLGYLDSLGRPYTLSHRLVRGLDYYTKTVFEVWAEGIGAQNAVCGGGRYDGLAEVLGGPPTPGVGFASGLERVVLTMKQQGVQVPTLPSPQVLIAHLGEQAKLMGLKLVGEMRAAGIGALVSFGDRSLKSQLRQADRAGAAFALIIGEREAEAGQVAVRDMAEGEQHSVALEEVTSWLSQRLG